MTDRVLPFLLILPKVWESCHDELVDLIQSAHSVRRCLYGHGDQRDVGEWRLNIVRKVRLVLSSNTIHV